MDVVDLVRAFALAGPEVQAVSSNGVRGYSGGVPSLATYPLFTIALVSDTQFPHLRQRGPGFARPRLQVDAWATSHPVAKRLGLALQRRLQGFVGELVDDTVSPPTRHVVAIEYESGFDARDPDAHGGYWRRVLEFFVVHQGTAQ